MKKPEPITSEKAGSWGGAGATAVEPLARRGSGGEGERRRGARAGVAILGGGGALGENGLQQAADPAVWELGARCPLTQVGALMRGCEAEGSMKVREYFVFLRRVF